MNEITTTTSTPDSKRDALRAKIEAAERRNAERSLADQAREAAQAAADYTRAHPLTVLGGAILVGLLIGLATRPGRRAATRAVGAVGAAASGAASSAASGVRQVTARGTGKVGTLVSESLIAYGIKVIDEMVEAARAGQDRIEDFGDDAADTARRVRREAGHKLATAADSTRTAARKTQRKATRAVRDAKRGATRKTKG